MSYNSTMKKEILNAEIFVRGLLNLTGNKTLSLAQLIEFKNSLGSRIEEQVLKTAVWNLVELDILKVNYNHTFSLVE